jgi:hypothetical protein
MLMKALWSLFWSVCQLRRGPDDMPYSLELLLLVLVLDIALGMGTQWLAQPELLQAGTGMVLLGMAMDALVLWALVHFKQVQLRYVQSLTAIYGADFMMGLFILPLMLASLMLPKVPWAPVLYFAQMLLVGWSLGIRAFIYHRTLAIGVIQANMLSLTLFLLNIFIIAKLFPELLSAPAAH